VAWNQFVTITRSKAGDAGSHVILVNPRNTSQMCSRCGDAHDFSRGSSHQYST
jgi:putative transposase